MKDVISNVVDLQDGRRTFTEPRVEHRLKPRRGRHEHQLVRVKYPALDAERHVAQLRIVDELWVDSRLGLEPGLWGFYAIDRGSAEAGRKNIGE